MQRYVPQDAQSYDSDAEHRAQKLFYALTDPNLIRPLVTEYLHESMSQAFATILSASGGFVRWTYQLALRYCKSSSTSPESLQLLRNTFELWMAFRVSMRDFVIIGDTRSRCSGLSSAPLLEAQVSLSLFWDFQSRLSSKVLQALERLVLKRDPKTWVVRYLVIFMLLHNASLVIADDAAFARKRHFEVSIIFL